MKPDWANPSREGRGFVRLILGYYAKDYIADHDYARMERELLDVIRSERKIALRAPRWARRQRTGASR